MLRTLRFSLLLFLAAPAVAQQEAILQYFNTPWMEIERRLPELAEAGYSALWLPPPSKGSSGGFSVGYDPLDRFDLGDKNQAGSVRTRYGTKAELLSLVEKAHRFGIRVYFDNVIRKLLHWPPWQPATFFLLPGCVLNKLLLAFIPCPVIPPHQSALPENCASHSRQWSGDAPFKIWMRFSRDLRRVGMRGWNLRRLRVKFMCGMNSGAGPFRTLGN